MQKISRQQQKVGNFTVHFGLPGGGGQAPSHGSSRFHIELYLLRGQTCASEFLLDHVAFIYSSYLIVLSRLLLIMINSVGSETP